MRITAGSTTPTTGGYPQEPPVVRPTTGGLKLAAGSAGGTLPTLAYRRFKKTPVVGGLEPPVTASSVVVIVRNRRQWVISTGGS